MAGKVGLSNMFRKGFHAVKNPVFSLNETSNITSNNNEESRVLSFRNGLLSRSRSNEPPAVSPRSPLPPSKPSRSNSHSNTETTSIVDLKKPAIKTSSKESLSKQNGKKNLKFYLDEPKPTETKKQNVTALPKLKPPGKLQKRLSKEAKDDDKLDCFKFRNLDDFCEAVCESRIINNYSDIQHFLEKTFGNFENLVNVFKERITLQDVDVKNQIKIDLENVELDLEYLEYVNQSMVRMENETPQDVHVQNQPKDIQKAVLRSIINCMLNDRRGSILAAFYRKRVLSKDVDVKIQSPLFSDQSTYTIFSHVLRHVAMLQNKDHHQLITWLKKIPGKEYLGMIKRIKKLIDCRLFPQKHEDIPEGEKSAWWIPNGVKVLALLNAANEQEQSKLAPRSTFYIRGVECMDLVQEYHKWQTGSTDFSFCQYPFVLSVNAKRFIMQKDSETKMLNEARQSLVSKVKQKQAPSMGMLFLNLNIRRNNLLEDSLREAGIVTSHRKKISLKQGDLKKKLRVIFKGEPGIDLGGVSKEWFFLIMQRFFNEDYGMFKYNKSTHLWWFSSSSKDNFQEYNLCGVLLGLAMYNGINLDIKFPPCIYKKLLNPAIVPYNNPHAPVGVLTLGMDAMKEVYPDLAKGLNELLNYEGDVEDDLCQTFQVSYTEFGQVITRQLKPEGHTLPVTKENREEYVNLYIDYLLNRCIYQQFYSFYHGFHSVCASNALLLLRPAEVETLVIGDNEFNIKDLEKCAKLDGFTKVDVTIKYLWETVFDYNIKMQRQFLFFCTGSDRVPVGGMKEMKFKITRVGGRGATDMLPMAHTCFNQLCLPAYKSRKTLKEKLAVAIQNAEGFGLE